MRLREKGLKRKKRASQIIELFSLNYDGSEHISTPDNWIVNNEIPLNQINQVNRTYKNMRTWNILEDAEAFITGVIEVDW